MSKKDDCEDTSIPEEQAPEFVAELCLFCPEHSASLEANILHMQKRHGLFITHVDRLVVDMETLIRYLFLVIFQHHECIYCHSQRRTVEAAQQHMVGKGHCMINIEDADSEYGDFFDFQTETGEGFSPTWDDRVVRLPSGKAISSRTGPPGQALHSHLRHHDSLPNTDSDIPDTNAEDPPNAQTTTLQVASRSERRGAPLTTALSKLNVNDQRSLAHLSQSEQRAVIATQRKQTDKARRAELRRRSRVDLLGNKTLMEHFISETPARRLRYAWC